MSLNSLRKAIKSILNESFGLSYPELNNEFINVLIGDADLDYLKSEDPDGLGFDICEAIYVFRHDYNEDNPFMHYLNSLLVNAKFKARPSLNSVEDLNENGQMIYDTLVSGEKFYTENYLEGAYDETSINEDADAVDTDNEKVTVTFYLDADGSGDVFAYFPEMNYDRSGDLKSCYAHVGQHSSCSPNYVQDCELATPEQYSDLKHELESIGYNLNII